MTILSKKLDRFQVSASVAAREIVTARKREGLKVIDLTVGEPDFDTPSHVIEAAYLAMKHGETRYPPSQGTRELRQAVAQKYKADFGLDYGIDEIIVSTGAKQVLFNALFVTLDPGDEVIVPAPYWVSYPDMVLANGGTPVCVPSSSANDYKITPEALEKAITSRTKWLILNSPNNPSGAVYDKAELAGLAAVLDAHPHVWVMTDDIYADLTYNGARAPQILEIAPRLKDRTLVVNGVSKSYAMTGFRIGYGLGPKSVISASATIQSQMTSGASSISQAAAVAALTGPQDFVVTTRAAYQKRRDMALSILKDAPGLQLSQPQGAFYIFADATDLMGSITPSGKVIETDSDLTLHLLDAVGVAVIGGGAYGQPGSFRLSFAAADELIAEGCTEIVSVCQRLTRKA